MPNYNEKVDAYIAKAQPFAQPILEHLRELIHKVCPAVEEKIKWGMPFFDYKGEMMCHIASFKQHAVMGFWKGALMSDPTLMQNASAEASMGHLGKITSLKDLPSGKKLVGYIKEAMKLNEDGIKIVKKPVAKAAYVVPDYITAAIKKNKKAFATWEAFAPSHKKEYAQWIHEAKTDATKEKRMAQTIEWLIEGKQRNWKYQ
jgi:uncharacterized protein YdeI (YjbR/CyaY-like superfamily)